MKGFPTTEYNKANGARTPGFRKELTEIYAAIARSRSPSPIEESRQEVLKKECVVRRELLSCKQDYPDQVDLRAESLLDSNSGTRVEQLERVRATREYSTCTTSRSFCSAAFWSERAPPAPQDSGSALASATRSSRFAARQEFLHTYGRCTLASLRHYAAKVPGEDLNVR